MEHCRGKSDSDIPLTLGRTYGELVSLSAALGQTPRGCLKAEQPGWWVAADTQLAGSPSGDSASALMPLRLARMLRCHSASRRAMIRSSLSGKAPMALVMPDGAGPIRPYWRSRVPSPAGSSSKRQDAEMPADVSTSQAKQRSGVDSATTDVVSQLPISGC